MLESGADADPTIEGALALEFATTDRPAPSRDWLKGLAAVMAERARSRSMFSAGSHTYGASTQLPISPVSDDSDRTPTTTTRDR